MLNKSFSKLNLTEIQPEGWLLDQLKIQMNGLTGKLYQIWDSVGSYSGWLGGTGESWERAPYYLDGLLPISYYLKDEEHMDLCRRFLEWTLNSQDDDGNFGPVATKNDYWSRFIMMKVFVSYYEISGDPRVLPFMKKYFEYVDRKVQTGLTGWSKMRVPDLLYCMKWFYEQTGDETVFRMAKRIDGKGFDWNDYLADFPFPRPTNYYINWAAISHLNSEDYDRVFPYHATHVVNVTMGFKHPAMRFFFTGDRKYRSIAEQGIKTVIGHHGVASGCINGDEHLSGNSPMQGSELCSVVEYMFSLQSLIEEFGDPYYGDLLERLAYNALPATITEDFMGHQYLQQANQVLVNNSKRVWFNNGGDANLFGLEPYFGCCTANMHQGWPKFVGSLWYKEGPDTLVSMAFAPNCVTTTVREKPVSIELRTEYPFNQELVYRFLQAPDEKISIKIRIPSWCKSPAIVCDGAAVSVDLEKHMITVEKAFCSGDEIKVSLPMAVMYSRWYKDSVAVERGPLVYGLNMKENWETEKELAGVKDYCVYPGSPWNYAIAEDSPAQITERPVSRIPFSKKDAPVTITLHGKRVDGWGMDKECAGDVPQSPVSVENPEEEIALIPFGCTNLRVSQFPYYR